MHFLSGSLSLSQIDLADSDDIGEIEATIRTFVDAHPEHKVYVGRGWLYGSFSGGLPDKALLDRLIPNKPAIMRCYDGHTVWVNTAALQAAGSREIRLTLKMASSCAIPKQAKPLGY